MLEFKIIVAAVIIAFAYSIMIRQGEILQSWARLLNLWHEDTQTWYSKFISKLFLCPYCFAGQLSMWISFYYLLVNKGGYEYFITVPFSIVIMWFIANEYLKK